MFIGVYLFGCGVIYLLLLLGLLAIAQARKPIGEVRGGLLCYSGLAALASVLGLAGFILFSMQLNLLAFGVPQDYSIPGDYLAAGPAGLLVLALGAAGMLSPLLVALGMRRAL
jgi:hypothetical protein